MKDGEKKHRLSLLNRRVAELQRDKKWEPLKRVRHKHRNVAEYYDRLDAKRIAEMAEKEASMVVVGYPRNIKYENYRGNGERKLRRMIQQHFPYGRKIQYIVEECAERGVMSEPALEA